MFIIIPNNLKINPFIENIPTMFTDSCAESFEMNLTPIQ